MVKDYIESFMNKVYKFLDLIIFIISFLTFLSSQDHTVEGGCGEGSRYVAYARSIPEVRIKKMYFDLKKYVDKGQEFRWIRGNQKESPVDFSDINYKNLYLSKRSFKSRFLLNGCFDHHIIIYFSGVIDDDTPSAKLVWGEGPSAGSEILWEIEANQ